MRLKISLSWKGVDNTQNTYELPIFCMPCDSDICSNKSTNHYPSQQDWVKRRQASPKKNVCTDNCNKTIEKVVIPQEKQVFKQQV